MNKRIFALGFFDGVHLGHQALLSACRVLADRLGLAAGALTFDRHPAGLVSGETPALINTASDRERLLRHYGMDRVLVLPFDEKLMHTPWQVFVARLLEEYGAAGLVCGEDFRFGDRGEGTAQLLKKACAIANKNAGVFETKIADAIIAACDDVCAGCFHDQFIVDPIQGSAGTSMNMNANEVIANVAVQKLGGTLGDYKLVHPNDHVNCGQSTNDIVPTAGKMTTLVLLKGLDKSLEELYKSFCHSIDLAEAFVYTKAQMPPPEPPLTPALWWMDR